MLIFSTKKTALSNFLTLDDIYNSWDGCDKIFSFVKIYKNVMAGSLGEIKCSLNLLICRHKPVFHSNIYRKHNSQNSAGYPEENVTGNKALNRKNLLECI